MNPVELLLCILGFFALVLPVCAVDAQELAREGLPGVRAIAITVGPRQLLQLAPVDWPKVDEVREVFARSFPGSMGRPYPPEGNARLRPGDPLYDTALDGAPALSREAATIQELVLVGGGRMDLDELLIVLEDSFGIHLSPEAAEAAARTVPDLEVLTSDDGSAQVFVIPQATMSEMEIRALEKRVYAGLVDLRRESAPETWDSFVASLPLALKGEPAPAKLSEAEEKRAGALRLLDELLAWRYRAPRTQEQLRALQEFGFTVEEEAYPLRVVSTGISPVREEDRTALEAAIGDLSTAPVVRLHPGGIIFGAFQENTPATRATEPGEVRAWSPELGREIARVLADDLSLSETTWVKKAFLHVAEGRLVRPAFFPEEMVWFCQRLLGRVPDAVVPFAPKGLLLVCRGPGRWEAANQNFGIHFSPIGDGHSACGERFAPRFSSMRADVTCPFCADTWTTS